MAQILLVDDSEFIHEQIGAMLQINHFEYLTALSGRLALRMVRDHPEIRLVFLDINMPEMNGMEVLATLRGEEFKGRDLAIVVLSAQLDPELLTEAEEKGANGWIVKPPSLDNILPFVKSYVLGQ